jgi:exodeoxyribonuclease VII large subunit
VAIEQAIARRLDGARRRLVELATRLDALSPLAVLGRGYAIVRREADGQIVRRAAELSLGERLDLRLGVGRAQAEVVAIDPEEDSEG